MFQKSLALIFLFGMFSLPPAFAEESGRYQLFQGKYQHWDMNSNTAAEQSDLFLLDTTTGDVQVYMSTVKNGKQSKYWSPAVFDENAS